MFTKATIEKQTSQEGSLPKNIQLLSVTSFHLNKKKKQQKTWFSKTNMFFCHLSFLMDTLTIANSPEDSEPVCGTTP